MDARAYLRQAAFAAGEAMRPQVAAPETLVARIATLDRAELAGWCAGRVLLGLGWREGELSALRDRARVLGVDLPLPATAEAAAAVLRGPE